MWENFPESLEPSDLLQVEFVFSVMQLRENMYETHGGGGGLISSSRHTIWPYSTITMYQT